MPEAISNAPIAGIETIFISLINTTKTSIVRKASECYAKCLQSIEWALEVQMESIRISLAELQKGLGRVRLTR